MPLGIPTWTEILITFLVESSTQKLTRSFIPIYLLVAIVHFDRIIEIIIQRRARKQTKYLWLHVEWDRAAGQPWSIFPKIYTWNENTHAHNEIRTIPTYHRRLPFLSYFISHVFPFLFLVSYCSLLVLSSYMMIIPSHQPPRFLTLPLPLPGYEKCSY